VPIKFDVIKVGFIDFNTIQNVNLKKKLKKHKIFLNDLIVK